MPESLGILQPEKGNLTMDTLIRWMSSSDVDSVQNIRNECSLDYDKNLLKILSSPNCILKVAEHNGKICGFIIYKNSRIKVTIIEIAVSPAFRRMGVAFNMLNSISSKAIESSKYVELFVPEDNLELQMTLKKCGFKASGIHDRKGSPHYRFSTEITNSKA
jgi:ribosomal-protein-alanine N-acetyltransferase